ncbi:NAD(P)-dependent oxidoreductase [Nosocomiicoccus massiliensis]|uniref:NAD(P)-dependent oxidoreductase n=1 Tax=Nosocomiicoccus massiliensis TaxID=1232430 RepID=A0AAF1BTD0_9STAP|nr:NAD(P)-dependent oxidoreductase [Nosocomiicoccus massiliensis]WOS96832.1 NAD(P)-dependent oxidoreductase [Nosocomiicoccus massiliensis]
MVKILSNAELDESKLKQLEEKGVEFKYVSNKEDLTEDLLKDVDVFNTYGGNLKEDMVELLQSVKWINVMSAGVDNIPESLYKNKIITNVSGIHKIPMAEYTIGLLLAHYKKLYEAYDNQKNKKWDYKLTGGELYGKTAIILGTGEIGKELARLLKAFHVKVIGFNTSGRDVEYFDETESIDNVKNRLSEADFVVSILPSTKKTRGSVDIDFFKHMNDEAVFVNIGRGDLIEDETLKHVLDKKLISHLILDVFNDEPLDKDAFIYEYDNVTITPHGSARTNRYTERALDMFLDNLENYLNDEELFNLVSYEKGY